MYFHLAWNQRSWGSVVTFSFSGGWVGCPSQVHGANTRGKCHSLCITVVFSLSASASPAGSCAALWWRNTLLSCWRWRSSLRKKRRGKLFWKCIGDGRQQFSQILKELSIESQNRWDWKRALRSPSPTPLHPTGHDLIAHVVQVWGYIRHLTGLCAEDLAAGSGLLLQTTLGF